MKFDDIRVGMQVIVSKPEKYTDKEPHWFRSMDYTHGTVVTVESKKLSYFPATRYQIPTEEVLVKENTFSYRPEWLSPAPTRPRTVIRPNNNNTKPKTEAVKENFFKLRPGMKVKAIRPDCLPNEGALTWTWDHDRLVGTDLTVKLVTTNHYCGESKEVSQYYVVFVEEARCGLRCEWLRVILGEDGEPAYKWHDLHKSLPPPLPAPPAPKKVGFTLVKESKYSSHGLYGRHYSGIH